MVDVATAGGVKERQIDQPPTNAGRPRWRDIRATRQDPAHTRVDEAASTTPSEVARQIVSAACSPTHPRHRDHVRLRVSGARLAVERGQASNITLDQTAGSPSLAAAGQRAR